MRYLVLAAAAAAALALAGCNQLGLGGGSGSGPPLPAPQPGTQAPQVLTPPAETPRRANIDAATRTSLTNNITDLLNGYANQFAPGMAAPAGFADEITPMEPRTDHRWRFDLVAGTPYTILGACDGDCTNVDIELIDSHGGVVASDMLPDDYPVVNFTPTANGTYYARALLQVCTVAPCFVGMRVLTPGAAGNTGK